MKLLDFIKVEEDPKPFLLGVEGDPFLVELGVRQWCRRVELDERETMLVDAHTTLAELAEKVMEIPLFSQGKVLIFEGVDKASSKTAEAFVEFLQTEGGFSKNRIVLVGSWRKNSRFLKQWSGRADMVWGEVGVKDMPAYVEWRQKELEAPLSGRYQSWLIARIQEDFRKIDLVLTQWNQLQDTAAVEEGSPEKLFLSLLPKVSPEETYRLTGAIRDKKLAEALRLVNQLLLQGQSEFSLLGYLASYMTSLLQVQRLAARGMQARAIADALGRKSDYPIRKNLEELPTWSTTELEGMFHRLERVEQKIRQGHDGRFLMELLVIAMCSRKGEKHGHR